MRNRALSVAIICMLLVYSAKTFGQSVSQSFVAPDAGSRDSVYVEITETQTAGIYRLIYDDGWQSEIIYEMISEDGSSVDMFSSYRSDSLSYDCIALFNNGADGNSFLFFNRADKHFYITPGCYAAFYPLEQSVDFARGTVILKNTYSIANSSEVLDAGDSKQYFGHTKKFGFIRAALVPYEKDLSPTTYAEFKARFRPLKPGSGKEPEPGEALSKNSRFHPYGEGSYATVYPLGVISDYRGMDMFTVFERNIKGYEGVGEIEEQVALWVYPDSVPVVRTGLMYGFSGGEGGDYWQNYELCADTSFIIHSDHNKSPSYTGMTATMKTVAKVRYKVDTTGNLDPVEFMDLYYTTPYFFPNDTTKWVGDAFAYDDTEFHPVKERAYRIFPPARCISPFECWLYVAPSKNGSWCTILMCKNEYDEITDALTICPDNDAPLEPLVFTPSKRYGRQKGNVTGALKFQTASGLYELTPRGHFKKVKRSKQPSIEFDIE